MATTKSRKARAQAIFDQHFEFHARYNGDEAAKKSAAEAKRVATSLKKALTQFAALLDQKELQALQDAAHVMAGLGGELDTVCKLARNHKLDRAAQDLAEYHRRVELAAHERWGTDDALMLAEAKELSAFIDQAYPLEVEDWIKAQFPGVRYAIFPDRMVGAGRMRLHDTLSCPLLDMVLVRRLAGEYLHILRDAIGRSRRYQEMYYIGLDDFDRWQAWRKEIAGRVVPTRNATSERPN